MRASAMDKIGGKTGSGGSNFDVTENSAPAKSFMLSYMFTPGEVVLAMRCGEQWWPAITTKTRQTRNPGIGSTSCRVGYRLAYFHPKTPRQAFVEEEYVKPFEDLPLKDFKHKMYFEKLQASFQIAKRALEIPQRERFVWWINKKQKLRNDAHVSRSHRQQHRSSGAKKTPEVGASGRRHPSKSSGTRKTPEVSSSIPIKLNDGHETKKIAIVSKSHPRNPLTAMDAENIRMAMDNSIVKHTPLILTSKFDRGALLIDYADKFDRKFRLDYIIDIFNCHEWCGNKFKAVPAHSVLPDTVVIAFETRDIFSIDPLRLFRRLALLNPGLKTTKWEARDRCRLIDREDQNKRRARWIIEIDQASARTIRKMNMELSVGSFGKGSVEILNGEALHHRGTPLRQRGWPNFPFRPARLRALRDLCQEIHSNEREQRKATLDSILNQARLSSQLIGGSGASNSIAVLPSPMPSREAVLKKKHIPPSESRSKARKQRKDAAVNPATLHEAKDDPSLDNSSLSCVEMAIASLSLETKDESSVDNSSLRRVERDIASLSLVDKEEESASLAGEQTQPDQLKSKLLFSVGLKHL